MGARIRLPFPVRGRHPITLDLRLQMRWREGKSDANSRTSSEIAVDTASRPHYNTPAYRRSRLRTSRLTDQGFAYAQRAGLLIRTASRDDVPPRSHPFFGEATTPDPPLISSPGGGASPYSTLMPGLQRSPHGTKRQAMPSRPQHTPL